MEMKSKIRLFIIVASSLILATIICLFMFSDSATHRAKLLPASPMPLLPASPLPAESIGLYLEAEPRGGPMGAPYTICCNVCLHNLNNTSIPIWRFPRTIFYAEQGGQFYALRLIEQHSGGIFPPYSMTGLSVALPRPPQAGRWNIFAVQEHSDLVYQSHLRDHTPKFPLEDVADQDQKYGGMWTESLFSNVITVEFAEIAQEELKIAESVTRSMAEAGQYKPEFREPMDDPTKGASERFFRWRSKADTRP